MREKNLAVKMKAVVLFAAVLFAFAPFCARRAVCAPAEQQKSTLRFGVNPWGPEEQMHQIFRPLMDLLGERLGVKFEIVIPSNYEELLKRTASGEIDIGAFNAVTYLQARHTGTPVKYIATLLKLNEGETEPRDYYIGFIIVRKDSPYRKLEDLRGKKFAFVDKDSGSGYKMPVAMLGLDYHTTPQKFFRKYFFVGVHDEVARAVYYGSVDGGATWDNSYMMMTKPDVFGDAFRIIAKTPPIPNDAWVAAPGVPDEIVQRLRAVLITIDKNTTTADGRKVVDTDAGFPGTGWSERTPDFYEAAAKYLLYENK